MQIGGRRRSSNFEDRGTGAGGGGALPVRALAGLVRMLGVKGVLVVGAVCGVGYLFLPAGVKDMLFGLAGGTQGSQPSSQGSGSVCQASTTNAEACDFSRVVLASTEDVWSAAFERRTLPKYAGEPAVYQAPTLVVFGRSVATGCGNASSDTGPFYCPRDRKLYIDPSFYEVMEKRLRAPGDFAQAYVIAHEVGHHVQHLIGATEVRLRGESENQLSVRIELQADCFAGVWGHTARASLAIDDDDLREAVTAAHAIGDDTLGNANEAEFTHGTSAQRMRWFRRGFETGDARQCDTFAVSNRAEL